MPGFLTSVVVESKLGQAPSSCVSIFSLGFLRLLILLGFRLLFPPWKFFDSVGDVPQLLVREQDQYGTWSVWEPLYHPQKRQWIHFWINSEYNDFLARGSVLQRFCEQIEEYIETAGERSASLPGNLREFATYRILERFVELEVLRRDRDRGLNDHRCTAAFQFKIVTYQFSRNERRIDDFVISQVYVRSAEFWKRMDEGLKNGGCESRGKIRSIFERIGETNSNSEGSTKHSIRIGIGSRQGGWLLIDSTSVGFLVASFFSSCWKLLTSVIKRNGGALR